MIQINTKMEELYNWIFHFNPYTKKWAAFKREDASDYFNGAEKDSIIKSTQIATLKAIIIECKGDVVLIHKKFKVC